MRVLEYFGIVILFIVMLRLLYLRYRVTATFRRICVGITVIYSLMYVYTVFLSRLIISMIELEYKIKNLFHHLLGEETVEYAKYFTTETYNPMSEVVVGMKGSSQIEAAQFLVWWKRLYVSMSDPWSPWYSLTNLFLNVVLYIPFGILILAVTYHAGKVLMPWRKALVIGIICSLATEIIQLITGLGQFDLLDIVMNTTGCIIGVVVFTKVVVR